jgi:polyisoprenoid-binding protein YceI
MQRVPASMEARRNIIDRRPRRLMTTEYVYDPTTLSPWLAGLAAGAVGAMAGILLAFSLRSPDDIVANSVSVTVAALIVGLASGWLWRRVRATTRALPTFRWAVFGGLIAALVAIAIVDQVALANLIPYAGPIAAAVFASVGLLTPFFATHHFPGWGVAVLVVLAVALAIGLFGRGNVESGELSLSDLTTTTLAPTANTQSETTVAPSTSADPADVAPVETFTEYVINQGSATWSVPENLYGLDAVAVGRSDELTGTISPQAGASFEIDLTSFTSDQPRRDEFVRRLFGSDPIATFTSESFEVPEAADGEVVMLEVPGTLTVNGTPRDVVWSVEARKVGSVVEVTGEVDVTLSEFGITPPSLGFVQVEDQATLEVLFQADGR